MIKRISLLFLMAMSAQMVFAAGPIKRHKDPATQLEFDNVYQDIRSVKLTSATLPSGSSQYAIINPSSPQTGPINLTTGTINSFTATSGTFSVVNITSGTINSFTANSGTFSVVNVASGTVSFINVTTANVQNINGSFIGVGRNRIINGDMRMDQRFVGSTATINASSIYVLDRWHNEGVPADGVYLSHRDTVSVPTGFTHALKITINTADASIAAGQDYDIRQAIEGTNVRDFNLGTANAKTFTCSFWVKSSMTGTFGMGFMNSGFNRSYVGQYTVNTANTWEFKTIVVPGDTSGTWLTTSGSAGLRVFFDLGNGTSGNGTANTWNAAFAIRAAGNNQIIGQVNANWAITGVQLELGSVATAYEYVPDPILTMQCQRYYEKSYEIDTSTPGAATGTGRTYLAATNTSANRSASSYVFFKVTKRTTPSVTLYDSNGSSGVWGWVSTAGTETSRTSTTDGITSHGFYAFQGVTGAETESRGHWIAASEL